jgi:sulfide:quinone oxidoreductase
MRNRHIKWITNAKVTSVDDGMMHVTEVNDDGSDKKTYDLPFGWGMLMPPFRGIAAVRGVEGLSNPRGFILTDKHQRNPTYRNVFALGVCIAIPPTGPTPVPVGVPKTGFMIESMVSAITANLKQLHNGEEPSNEATWNAICLADFGDGGVAFVAKPQIPPRNVNWSSEGKWVHLAKIGFEKYFLRKVRMGESEPFYEKLALHVLGMNLDRAVLAFAGMIVLVSAILAVTVSPWWIALTLFAGANMLQASLTGWCPAAMIFKALGVRAGTAFR